MTLDLSQCLGVLRENDNFLVLSHDHPDGDTLGSAFALMYILKKLGKKCRFLCADPVPKSFSYIFDEVKNDDIVPEFVIAVDVADEKLLGKLFDEYKGKTDLCIDHHASNTHYAKYELLEDRAAACEIIYNLALCADIKIDKYLGECIYTGISTDTGCFKYQNTTSSVLRIAAELYDVGIDYKKINKLMFETVSKNLLALELLARETLEYRFDGRCALITLTRDMYEKSGSGEDECYGITALPRQIEGVLIGAVIKEKQDGSYGISVRTGTEADASEICARLGGGGHKGAAGCRLYCSLEETKERFFDSAKITLDGIKK